MADTKGSLEVAESKAKTLSEEADKHLAKATDATKARNAFEARIKSLEADLATALEGKNITEITQRELDSSKKQIASLKQSLAEETLAKGKFEDLASSTKK